MISYFKEIGLKRILLMLLGVIAIGIGVACLRFAGFGTDPFSCMNIGVSSHLPMSYGTYQMIVNVILFIPVILLCPRSFGIGAFVNMLGVGYIVDFCVLACGWMKITVETVETLWGIRMFLVFIGILILCFGVALYMNCDLGVAPYDMIAQIAQERTNGRLKFKWVRIALDVTCMLIGIFTGGTFGIATVFVALFTGPVVSWFRKLIIAEKWLD